MLVVLVLLLQMIWQCPITYIWLSLHCCYTLSMSIMIDSNSSQERSVQQGFDRDTYLSKFSLWNGYTKLKHYLLQRKVQTFIISVCVWALRITPKASCIMHLEMKLYYAHTMLNYVIGFNLWPKGQAQVLKIEYGRLWLLAAVMLQYSNWQGSKFPNNSTNCITSCGVCCLKCKMPQNIHGDLVVFQWFQQSLWEVGRHYVSSQKLLSFTHGVVQYQKLSDLFSRVQ